MRKPDQAVNDIHARDRWEWAVPLLGVAMAAYMLWMGESLAWNHQHGHRWYFLAPWWTPNSVQFLAISAGLAAAFVFGRMKLLRRTPWLLVVVLLGGQIWCSRAALGIVGKAVPWGFDHPSFQFRLKEFGDLFPFTLGGYNPWWNAGTEHFVGAATGAHAYGMLNLAWLKFMDPHLLYGPALVFWFVFGFPWLGVVSARAAGIGRSGALCAGILMCGVSREVFMWMWHYGTIGAMTSTMMVLPVMSLGYRLAVLRRGGWGTALALALAAWLMCLWPPGLFTCAGLLLGWLWNARRWTWRSTRWLFAAGALALVLLAPWFWVAKVLYPGVAEHLGTAVALPEWGVIAANGAVRLGMALQEWHPALVFLGLGGALFAAPRDMRRWSLPVLLLLGAIAGWSREFKPLSQMDRMAIPMAVAAVLPAAALCGRLFETPDDRGGLPRRRVYLQSLAQGLVLAALLMGLVRVHRYYSNRDHTGVKMRTLSPELAAFADWIRAEVPEDGRLGFAGPAVHFYGGGNIAYLSVLTGREMMADDYYGFAKGMVEYNYPPVPYRKSVEGFVFFSQAYGITHWVSMIPVALDFFAAHPEQFEPVQTMPMSKRRIGIFRVKEAGASSRFFEGEGRVVVQDNRIEVLPSDPSAARVVIRYNWRDGLFCRTPGAAIEPFEVDENLRFIAVHPGGADRIVIGYRPRWAPLKPNFDGYFHH